jgi:hypothetical protein
MHHLEYKFPQSSPVISSGEGGNTVACRRTDKWTNIHSEDYGV